MKSKNLIIISELIPKILKNLDDISRLLGPAEFSGE